ncbi:hypothetical protein BDZ89DRAFT_1064542, partial [Hymenopellis radicata]
SKPRRIRSSFFQVQLRYGKSSTRWAGSQVRVRPTFSSTSAQTVFTGSTPELKTMGKPITTFLSRQNAAKRSPIKAESAQLLYELMEFGSSVRKFTHSAIK